MDRRLRPHRSSARRSPRHLALAALLTLALAGLGGCLPDGGPQGPEEGWIPGADGPRWVTYEVVGTQAIYQGDVRFRVDELRAWQATVEDPIPLRVRSYDMLDGSTIWMHDDAYADGAYGYVAGQPLSGSTGLLTDGEVPDPADAISFWYQDGWVSWSSDPSITFHFDEVETVDTVRLSLRKFGTAAYPDRVEIRAGGQVVTQTLGLDPNEPSATVELSGPQQADGSYAGLGLQADQVEVTLYRTGTSAVVLGEVAFESGTWPAPDPTQGGTPRAAVNRDGAWGAVVPYSIAGGFSLAEQNVIVQAFEEWDAKSDHTFVEDPTATPRIRVKPGTGGGCFSKGVGRPGSWEGFFGSDVREIRLDDSCFWSGSMMTTGVVLHEIGHALGFYHEQARRDRAKYVRYYAANVQSDKRSQYDKDGDKYGEYNYRSIMHYQDWAFARAMCCSDPTVDPAFDSGDGLPAGCGYRHLIGMDSDGDGSGDTCTGVTGQENTIVLKTLVPRVPLPASVPLGQRVELSKGDVSAANALLHGNFKARSYNSLSIHALAGWAGSATDHLLGDVDNDGRDDLVAVHDETAPSSFAGAVYVALGQPDGTFLPAARWHASFCYGVVCKLGDLDGDGRKDLVSFDAASGAVRVAWSYGGQFTTKPGLPTLVSSSLALNRDDFLLGDLDGNCTDDVLAIIRDYDAQTYMTTYWIRPAQIRDGVARTLTQFTIDGWGEELRLADVDGDARADLVHWGAYNDDVSVRYTMMVGDYVAFEPPVLYGADLCQGLCELADVDGDARADVVDMDWQFEHHLERVRIRQSTGYDLSTATNYHELDCRNTRGCLLGDVDGDGRADVVDVLRPPSQLDPGLDRDYGDVWVSLNTGLWSDPIGAVKPRAGGSIGSLSTCLDLPGFNP